jgi:hypothetical protein
MSYSKIVLIPLLILTLFSPGCEEDPTEPDQLVPAAFLPENNEISGWIRNFEVGNFIEAENTDGLVELFEGEANQKQLAETFIAHYFTRGVKQVYQGNIKGATEYLEIRLFDQETPTHAQELFHDKKIKPASFSYLDEIGDEGRIAITTSESIVTVDFYYEKWYGWFSISGRWGASEARQVALNFADLIYSKLLQYYPKNS